MVAAAAGVLPAFATDLVGCGAAGVEDFAAALAGAAALPAGTAELLFDLPAADLPLLDVLPVVWLLVDLLLLDALAGAAFAGAAPFAADDADAFLAVAISGPPWTDVKRGCYRCSATLSLAWWFPV